MSGSRNLNELTLITTIPSSALMYCPISPFDTSTDRAATYASVLAPTLQKTNNLSDVTNSATSQNHLFTNSNLVVNTTTTLSSSAFGAEVFITANGGYQITLPNPTLTPNGFIDFIYTSTYTTPYITSNNFVTLSTPAGDFNGVSSTLNIGAGDALRVVSDGVRYWTTNVSLKPVDFLVKFSGGQTVSTGVPQTLLYDTIVRDIGSGFNTSSNRYFPPVPGLYEFYHCTSILAGTVGANAQFIAQIQNNFGTPVILTSQNVNMGNDVSNSPSVSNKVETFLSNTLASSFSIIGGITGLVNMNLDTTYSFFGGRRLSLL